MSNIAFIGFKGVGKSSVGWRLAQELRVAFFDCDMLVEHLAEKSCRQIVAEGGFETLHFWEQKALEELGAGVLATGGSTVLHPGICKRLKSWGKLVYLQASFDLIRGRISESPSYCTIERWQEELEEHYKKRCPTYSAVADTVVDVDGKGIDDIVDEVCYGIQ